MSLEISKHVCFEQKYIRQYKPLGSDVDDLALALWAKQHHFGEMEGVRVSEGSSREGRQMARATRNSKTRWQEPLRKVGRDARSHLGFIGRNAFVTQILQLD